MGIVNGFTDILYPKNFITNGSFLFNSRGTFSSLSDAKVGDFIADSWKISDANGINNLKVDASYRLPLNRTRAIRFTGTGTSGAYFELMNINQFSSLNNIQTYDTIACSLTASIGVCTTDTSGSISDVSVPLNISVLPPKNPTYYSILYQNDVKTDRLTKSKIDNAVTCITSSNNYSIFNPYTVRVTLLAAGEFSVFLCNAGLYEGLIKHPPLVNSVHFAEDIIRCKLFYQKGQERYTALGVSDGSSYVLHSRVDFPVEMAGTPTVAYTNPVVYEEGAGDTNVESSYTKTISNVTSKGFDITVSKSASGAKPRLLQIDWTASV